MVKGMCGGGVGRVSLGSSVTKTKFRELCVTKEISGMIARRRREKNDHFGVVERILDKGNSVNNSIFFLGPTGPI